MRSSAVVSNSGVSPLERARLSTRLLFDMTSDDTNTAETVKEQMVAMGFQASQRHSLCVLKSEG